jgi:hypothetical protein
MTSWHKGKVGDMATAEAQPTGRMSRKLDPNDDPDRLNVVVPKSLVQRLNKWRAKNGFVGKSEAARILIERALDDDDARSFPSGRPRPKPDTD